MGFVDRLRMNNLYPSTGIGPPDMNGGLNINALLRRLMEQQNTPPPPSPMQFNYRNNLPPPQIPSVTIPANDMLSRRLTGLDQDLYGQKDRLERDKLAQRERLEQEKLDFGREKLAGTQDLGQQRVDVAKQRADIYKFKTENPNLQFKISQGGNFIAFDPQTGESIDTGVSSGTMSEEEKLKLIGTNQMNAITARGINSESLQRLRGNQRLNEIGATIAGRKDVAGMTPARTELPTQTRVRQSNVANQIKNTNPELAQFIHVNPDGSFDVDPPSQPGWFSSGGPTMDQYSKIQNMIYGSGPNTAAPTITNNPPASNTTVAPTTPTPQNLNVPKGRVAIMKDGKVVGSVPESQLQDAIKQGYTQVKSGSSEKK